MLVFVVKISIIFRSLSKEKKRQSKAEEEKKLRLE